MNKTKIITELEKIFKELNVNPQLLDSETNFHDLEIDSLRLFEIIVKIEDTFNISFNIEDLYKLKKFPDLVNLILKLTKK